MSGELLPLGPIQQTPAIPAPPVREVLSGYRLAGYGLLQLGRRRVDGALRQLEAQAAPAQDRALAALAAQELARRAGDWRAASEAGLQASALLRRAGSPTSAGIALASGVEALIIAGDTEAAAVRLKEVEEDGQSAIWLDAARALLQLAHGHVSEARVLLRRLPQTEEGSWTEGWARLLQAEVLLEMGGLVGAAEGLDLLATSMPRSARFTEASLRTLQLRAWLEVARAWSGSQPEQRQTLLSTAASAVARLTGYARNHPYYRAWALHLGGELCLLRRADPEPDFSAAVTQLDAIGARFTRARLQSRQAMQLRAAERRYNELRVGEARTTLLELGLPGRVGALTAAATPGAPAAAPSAAMRKSIAVRLEGNLENLNLTEESGLEALIEVSRYLSSILEVDPLLEKILESVVRVMGAERGALLRHGDGDALQCVAVEGLAREDVVEGSNEISFGVIREVQHSGEPVLTDNALADSRFMERKSVMATDIRSVLCSPIRTRQRTLGCIYLDRRLTSLPFTLEQQDLLAAFCTQAAVAWENALSFQEIEDLNVGLEQKVKERTLDLRESNQKLADSLEELTNTRLKLAEAQRDAMEKEMILAREIQESLLPPRDLIQARGHAYCGLVIPASYCGGDFWGYQRYSDDRTLLVVADVTGHGVAASLLTAVTRSCLDTLSSTGTDHAVEEVLAMLSSVVRRSAKGRLLATAFVCLVDPAARTLTYANAGSTPPYLVSPGGGRPTALTSRGLRLGEDEAARYEAHVKPYSAGDRLVLYTDGIVESRGPDGKMFGDRRFRRSLQALAEAPAPELIDKLIQETEAYCGGVERDDDLTLVAVQLD